MTRNSHGQQESHANNKAGLAISLSLALFGFSAVHADSEVLPDHVSDIPASAKPLTRTFISDAASIISPSVVNIVALSKGLIPTAQAGSGFIISEDGFVVTNAHVVAAAKVGGLVEITLSDMRKVQGRVFAMDKPSDIAIVKLEGAGRLPVAKLGVSGKLKAGEFVVAVGSPLQLQDSVTFGIVSAPARHCSELGITKQGVDYIQTDAAINVGNSGGPLVNLDGEVIGINCMKAQGFDGVSFAIPIDSAWIVITQLMKNKNVVRPYVGIRMINFVESADGRHKRDRGLFSHRGDANSSSSVLITDVTPGSPAANAGLESGDIIVGIDDKIVRHTKHVLDAIGMDVGKTVTMRVIKGGNQVNADRVPVSITLTTAGGDSHGSSKPSHEYGPPKPNKRHY
eukprot:CAMPEP_0185037416 /NCGR_PEP_ID=MMETSP1103-20130426/31779_1 /TAXON_ID=36769 /ORGANISM="Paraphysomonas bandaiensis, Strain Caron Lab Isolate" /LENGTH=397 /DNA_ID=CAMNT_0027575373 /DNA_START=139 /DNA_END=1332 /DNA_ORIENTATION=+